LEFFTASAEGGPRLVRLAVVLTSDNVAIWAPGFDPGQWKLLTHWLVAPGLLAAVLDVLCVYFAGRMVEELFGTRRFTLLFIAACVLAGLLAGLVDPLLMGQSRSVIMGPAAGAFAAFTTLAWIAPNQRSMLGFRMRPMVLTIVGVVCGLNLVMGLLDKDPFVRSPTQLLFGVALSAGYMTYLKARGKLPGLAPGSYQDGREGAESDPVAASLAQARKEIEQAQIERERERAARDADQQKLDAILAKISTQGIGSLSRGEKSFLDSQSRKRKDSNV
jgi:membrane associated rhomboid family serine protease